jgi:hypothetical protein
MRYDPEHRTLDAIQHRTRVFSSVNCPFFRPSFTSFHRPTSHKLSLESRTTYRVHLNYCRGFRENELIGGKLPVVK